MSEPHSLKAARFHGRRPGLCRHHPDNTSEVPLSDTASSTSTLLDSSFFFHYLFLLPREELGPPTALLSCCPSATFSPFTLTRLGLQRHFHKLLVAPPPSQWPSPTPTTAICLLRGSTWAAGKVGQPVERAAGQETEAPLQRAGL